MRNSALNIKNKLIAKYLVKDQPQSSSKSTDINVLLNRVKLDEKLEKRKKIYNFVIGVLGISVFTFIFLN